MPVTLSRRQNTLDKFRRARRRTADCRLQSNSVPHSEFRTPHFEASPIPLPAQPVRRGGRMLSELALTLISIPHRSFSFLIPLPIIFDRIQIPIFRTSRF
jgi:hypothetical protein